MKKKYFIEISHYNPGYSYTETIENGETETPEFFSATAWIEAMKDEIRPQDGERLHIISSIYGIDADPAFDDFEERTAAWYDGEIIETDCS